MSSRSGVTSLTVLPHCCRSACQRDRRTRQGSLSGDKGRRGKRGAEGAETSCATGGREEALS